MNKLGVRAINHPFTKRFLKTPWFGIFQSFAEARAAIPDSYRVGYSQPETQVVFRAYPVDRVRPADYAVMLHFRELLKPGGRLIDLGGSIGMACYTAQKYFALPSPFEWVLCDVPHMIETAKEVALREGEKSAPLRFTTDLKEAAECDTFFSSGALQFIEAPLPSLLASLRRMPNSVVINRIPVWDEAPLITLHDIGFCMTPYQVFNRKIFIDAMLQSGYKLIDTWSCPESTFSIRLHPRMRLNAYQGFYFSLEK